ncbi:MAG: hypothetical protein ACYDG2_08215 [Ruminiclostridium sp.]
MKITSYFIRLKLCAELKNPSKKTRNNTIISVAILKSENGGGLGTIFIGLAAILLTFIVFINIADYSLFTYKRNAISKAMDYAVTAAVQQINKNKSVIGLANGFTEETGERMLEGIEIDIDMAIRTFLTIFYENYGLNNFNIENNLLICATSTQDEKLRYTIKANSELILKGNLENPILIEEKVNQAIVQYWPSTEDESKVYLNGNPKTNMLENGTYLLALIKDFKIKGLYSQRNVSLSSFAGAKLERLVKD